MGEHKEIKNIILLCDVRSVHNVASIFRTADCLGIDKVILAGYTPAPVDRFGRLRKDFNKVSLGAEGNLAWESVAEPESTIKKLKNNGYQVIAVEQDEKSIDYREVRVEDKVVFVFGNEVLGVPKNVLKICDLIAEIPMKGKKESLNVSVTVGIAVSRMLI